MEEENVEDVPVIVGLNGKIGVLERRRDHLRRKLDRNGYGDTASADFDRAEIGALNAALRAMRFHAASLRPDLDPVVHLSRVVDALDAAVEYHGYDMDSEEGDELERRLRDARSALEDLV